MFPVIFLLTGEGLEEREKNILKLDQKIRVIGQSTRTLFLFAAPVHNKLRMRSKWYYLWHTRPFVSVFHFILLIIYVFALSSIVYSTMLTSPLKTRAAEIIWDGGGTDGTCGGNLGDGNKWSCAQNWFGDVVPADFNDVTFNSTSTKDASIDPAFVATISNLNINSGYTGTITLQRELDFQTGGTFHQSDGTFASGANNINLSPGTFQVSGGVFNAPSAILTASDGFVHSGGTFNNNDGTVVVMPWMSGTVGITTSSTQFYNLQINNTAMSIPDTTVTITGDFSTENDFSIKNDNGDYVMSVIGSSNPTITVSGDLLFPASASSQRLNFGSVIESENFALNLGGNLTQTDDGVWFYADANLVDSGTVSTISAAGGAGITFRGDLISTAGNKTIKFDPPSVYAVNGALNFSGTAGNLITLRSTSDGSQWNFIPSGSRTVSYVDVQDSNNSSGTDITANNSTGELQNNSGWVFVTVNSSPMVTTQAVPDPGEVIATANGNITDTGGVNPHTRGFEYGLTETGTWTWSEGAGIGSYNTGAYTGALAGLTAGQTYHIRAFAQNSEGFGYGAWVEFTTDDPTVTLSESAATLGENSGTSIITATLSNASAKEVLVNLDFAGTATNVTDYTRTGTSIIIPAGEITGTVTLTGVDDFTDDNDETIIVSIGSVTNGTESGSQSRTVTITDNDISYTITASTGQGGTISPSGVIAVDYGESKTFSFIPDDGYELSEVLVDAFPATVSSPYTFSSVGTNHTIEARFSMRRFSVGLSAEGEGSLESTSLNPSWGDSLTITTRPSTGHRLARITDNGVTLTGEGNQFVISPIRSNHLINAYFEAIPTTVTPPSTITPPVVVANKYHIQTLTDDHGTINPSGLVEVEQGQNVSFEIGALEGFEVDNIFVDGATVGKVLKYSFDNIVKDHIIDVKTKKIKVPSPVAVEPSSILVKTIDGLEEGLKTVSKTIDRVVGIIGITPEQSPTVLSAATVVSAGVSISMASAANIFSIYSFAEFFRSLWYSLLVALGLVKLGSRKWGKVVESDTNVSLSGVRVSLVSKNETAKVVASTYTDQKGRYGFIVEPGTYKITVSKQSYQAVAHGITVEVRDASEGFVAPTIQMTLTEGAITNQAMKIRFFTISEKIVNYFSLFLLAVGSVSVVNRLNNGINVVSVSLVVVYLVFWLLAATKLRHFSPWGIVVDRSNDNPLPLTMIRVIDEREGKLVKTAICNKFGKFSTLLPKGKYSLIAMKPGFRMGSPISFSSKDDLGVINRKIVLKKEVSGL